VGFLPSGFPHRGILYDSGEAISLEPAGNPLPD